MQWINFVRDIEEDNALGRCYFPKTDLVKFGLTDLSQESAEKHPDNFKKFVQFEIERCRKWQAQANAGFSFIPRKSRVAIKTAADMYAWAANEIEKSPMLVFEGKLRPSRIRIFARLLTNSL
jgi:phytoene synthase